MIRRAVPVNRERLSQLYPTIHSWFVFFTAPQLSQMISTTITPHKDALESQADLELLDPQTRFQATLRFLPRAEILFFRALVAKVLEAT